MIGASKPPSAPAMSTPFGATTRAQIRETEHLLRALERFEHGWDEFEQLFRQIIDACTAANISLWAPPVAKPLRKLEMMRVELDARQQGLLPAYRDPLAKFLRTSVRIFSPPLWELIGEFIYDGGQMLLPMDDADGTLYALDMTRFEINAGEVKGEIARRRLELEGQLRQQTTLLEEMQSSPSHKPEVTLSALIKKCIGKVPFPSLRRFLWAAFVDHIKTSVGVILVALVIGLSSHFFPNIVHALRAQLTRLAPDSSHAAVAPTKR